MTSLVAVPQYGLGFHEDLQFNLHDAPDRPLERLLAVLSANVAGFSIQLLGLHQRVAGALMKILLVKGDWFVFHINKNIYININRNPTGWSSIRGRCSRPCRICCA